MSVKLTLYPKYQVRTQFHFDNIALFSLVHPVDDCDFIELCQPLKCRDTFGSNVMFRHINKARVTQLTPHPTDWDYITVFLSNVEQADGIVKSINLLDKELGFLKTTFVIVDCIGENYNEQLLPTRTIRAHPKLRTVNQRVIFKLDPMWTVNPVILSLLTTTIRESIGKVLLPTYDSLVKLLGRCVEREYASRNSAEILDLYISNWYDLNTDYLLEPEKAAEVHGMSGSLGICHLVSSVNPEHLKSYEKAYGRKDPLHPLLEPLIKLAIEKLGEAACR